MEKVFLLSGGDSAIHMFREVCHAVCDLLTNYSQYVWLDLTVSYLHSSCAVIHILCIGTLCMCIINVNKKAVLSQGGPCDAAVNFHTYRSLQRHRAVFTAIA